MIPRQFLVFMVGAGGVLPVGIAVVLGVARLLSAMQDASGAAVLDRIALAMAIVWAVVLVALVMALAIRALGPPE